MAVAAGKKVQGKAMKQTRQEKEVELCLPDVLAYEVSAAKEEAIWHHSRCESQAKPDFGVYEGLIERLPHSTQVKRLYVNAYPPTVFGTYDLNRVGLSAPTDPVATFGNLIDPLAKYSLLMLSILTHNTSNPIRLTPRTNTGSAFPIIESSIAQASENTLS
ncbi:hypothetical protein KEM54_006596 [Ascosphaera aggregata]|nr:hypothetical protein KEM54_006596 [Ascosphaera aggregata]